MNHSDCALYRDNLALDDGTLRSQKSESGGQKTDIFVFLISQNAIPNFTVRSMTMPYASPNLQSLELSQPLPSSSLLLGEFSCRTPLACSHSRVPAFSFILALNPF